jgi:hypothetical protein
MNETKTLIQEVQSEILTRSSSGKIYKLRLKQESKNLDPDASVKIESNADITESVILEKNLKIQSENKDTQ